MRQHKMLKSKNEIQPFTVEYAPELIVLRAEFSDFRNKHTAWRLHKKRDVSFSFDDGWSRALCSTDDSLMLNECMVCASIYHHDGLFVRTLS